jgi:outer membrane protein assembly factor BamB
MKNTNPLLFAMTVILVLIMTKVALSQEWPQWRGINRDGKVIGFETPKTWPAELTPKWKITVGLGDASPVLAGGKLYTFTREGEGEVIRCLDAATGEEFWQYKYPALAITGPASSQHPGPRSTPVVGDGKIVTLGVGGNITCLDAVKGSLLWCNEDFIKDLPPFFTGLSPLIFRGMCFVHMGGKEKGEIIAFDLNTGKQKWQTTADGPSYASLQLITVKGKKQIVDLTSKNLVGIDPENGKLLWQIPVPTENRFYNAATPVIDGQTVIFTGQGQGTRAVRIQKKGDKFLIQELWRNKELGTKWNTPVLKNGFLYGLSDGRKLFCMNATTGLTTWIDSKLHNDFGTIVDAGTVIIALPQTSNLVVFKPDEKGFNEVAFIKVAETPTYSYPVLSGNRLYIKDKESLSMMSFK